MQSRQIIIMWLGLRAHYSSSMLCPRGFFLLASAPAAARPVCSATVRQSLTRALASDGLPLPLPLTSLPYPSSPSPQPGLAASIAANAPKLPGWHPHHLADLTLPPLKSLLSPPELENLPYQNTSNGELLVSNAGQLLFHAAISFLLRLRWGCAGARELGYGVGIVA